MAVVFALKRESARANPQQIPETDSVDIATIVRSTAGNGSLYNDASTTTVTIGTGSALTGVTIGGGAAYTGSTIGLSGQTDTFLGHVRINGNLNVNGTSTIVNSTAITTQDVLIEAGISTRTTAGQNLAFAFYGGSNASKDALIYWVQGSNRIDFGYGDTGATGGTLPAAPISWVDVKLNNLTVAGTTVTGVGASLTMTIASANLTVSTTTSGTLAVTSAGALNLSGNAASTWQNTGANLTIQTVTSGTLAITSAGALNLTGAAASTFAFTGGAFVLQTTGQNLTIQTVTSGTLAITGAAAVNISAGAASTWQTTAGALTITSAAAATWSTSAGLLTVQGTGGLTLVASGTTDITFNAHGGTTYTFNDASNLALNAGFVGVTSIVGALNYLWTNPNPNGTETFTNGNAGTITQGQCVYISAQDTVDLTNASADSTAQFVGVVQPAAGIATAVTGAIQVGGYALVRFKIGRHIPSINDPIFLDDTNNGYAVSYAADPSAEPSTAGHIVYGIGYVKNLNGNTAGTAIAGTDALVYVQLVPLGKTKL
jgi:hypothetical protein